MRKAWARLSDGWRWRSLVVALSATLAGCAVADDGLSASYPAAAADLVIATVWNQAPASSSPAWSSSAQVQRLEASIEARFAQLEPLYADGSVGLTADGFIALRDPANVPLADRNHLRGLEAGENADRAALYRQLAITGGHSDQESLVRSVFAQRWVAHAARGWFYQDLKGRWLIK